MQAAAKDIGSAEQDKKDDREDLVKAVRDNMGPGCSDTWQMCLLAKGDPRACRVKAIEEGKNLKDPFPLEFSSHPGLSMIKGGDIHGIGAYMLIGEASSENVM